MTVGPSLTTEDLPITVRVLDEDFAGPSRVRRVLVTLPGADEATCPLCAGALVCAELVDAHDMRRVGFLDLFEDPSDGSTVRFVPCGCEWDSTEDDRVFVASPLGRGLGFQLVDRDENEDAPDRSTGRARSLHPTDRP